MSGPKPVRAAIIDYGLGNLFSIKHACEYAGIEATVTASPREITGAELVILPGVGAFGDAIQALNRLDLPSSIWDVAASGAFLFGICLGMQLLMTESDEFGRHPGLGIIEGPVARFDNPAGSSERLKVPQVGWNRIFPKNGAALPGAWAASPLEGLADGEFMYFVHSYYPRPVDSSVVLSVTRYGDTEFCSSLRYRNIFASQFHPERSGPSGLRIYRNIVTLINKEKERANA